MNISVDRFFKTAKATLKTNVHSTATLNKERTLNSVLMFVLKLCNLIPIYFLLRVHQLNLHLNH